MTQAPAFAPPPDDLGAVASVIAAPTAATLPLSKLAPEAALRRLELTIVRRLAKIEKARAFWRFPAVLSQRPYGLHQRLEEIAPALRTLGSEAAPGHRQPAERGDQATEN